jgi:hypothetical protein
MSDLQKIKFSNTIRYYEIAKNSYDNVEQLAKNRNDELKKQPINHNQLIKYANSVHNEAIITIVFCTMTLESYINEYGITNSSRSFFQNHLEKLNLISKFTLIPKLNNKPELKTDKQEFQNLKWLINLRNDLTHYKIKEKDVADIDMTKPISQKDFILEEHAEKAIKTLEETINILEPDKLKFFNQLWLNKNN